MSLTTKGFDWKLFFKWSIIVFVVWAILFSINVFCVVPISNVEFPKGEDALSFLSAFLGLLAGGCVAGFFSFEYYYAEDSEYCIIQTIAFLLIGGIFLLIFLSLYCLAKVGIFKILDRRLIFLLFLCTYVILDSIVLLDRWDWTKRKSKDEINK